MAPPLFPTLPGLTFPVTRSNLGFQVDVLESISGIRTALPTRAVPRYQWAIGFEMLRQGGIGPDMFAELATLAGFYNGRLGRTLPFAYRDPRDDTATGQYLGTGDGATRTFQLLRTFGGFTEPVRAPLAASAVYLGGSVADPASYSVGATGRLTFATPPGAGVPIRWDGTFGWLCRFDDDRIDFAEFMRGYWSVDKITFSSELA